MVADSKVIIAVVGGDFLVDVDRLEGFEADNIGTNWHEVAIGVAIMLQVGKGIR